MLRHYGLHPSQRLHPGIGLDAAFASAFDDPLVHTIREMVEVIVFEDHVRKHPEAHQNDPRALPILNRLDLAPPTGLHKVRTRGRA